MKMRIKAILMDLDGTVYRGRNIIPGALETIENIRSAGIRLFFFTNNSERTRTDIAGKLGGMGIPCTVEDIVSSGYVATRVVKKLGLKDVFVSGSEGLRKEFTDAGIPLTDGHECRTLVIGMDSGTDYAKMTVAVNAAINADTIIVCNKERVFPVENGALRPGCGAMVALIEYCSGKEADIVVGKPNAVMFDYVRDTMGCSPGEIMVVGDTYASDIAMARNCGALSVLIGDGPQDCTKVDSIADLPSVLREYL